MKRTLLALASCLAMAQAFAQSPQPGSSKMSSAALTKEDVQAVSPALYQYTQSRLLGDVWKRPGLGTRDRALITVAVFVARNQTADLPFYLNLALDSGVKPSEISEVITHLAFYAGWGNAMSAVVVAKQVFAQRGIGAAQLPPASPPLMAIDEKSEAVRSTTVQQNVGPVSQGLVDYTGDVLFKDLWLRPGLAPRDRSLVTMTALISAGQVAQIPFHLNKAMDNGLTQAEASEILTHLAFYAGWPNVMSAVPVAKTVFDARAK